MELPRIDKLLRRRKQRIESELVEMGYNKYPCACEYSEGPEAGTMHTAFIYDGNLFVPCHETTYCYAPELDVSNEDSEPGSLGELEETEPTYNMPFCRNGSYNGSRMDETFRGAILDVMGEDVSFISVPNELMIELIIPQLPYPLSEE